MKGVAKCNKSSSADQVGLYPNVTWRIILYGFLFTTELRHTCTTK